MMLPDYATLLDTVLSHCTNRDSPFHGPDHWRRVAWIGLRLCEEVPEADPRLVLLFGVFHDTMRLNDDYDPEHGRRASGLIRHLNGKAFTLEAPRRELLCRACDLHADGLLADDSTIAVCWDADRLDLWRVGMNPDPAYFSTTPGRRSEMASWSRSLLGETPDWVEVWSGYEDLLPERMR